MPADSKSLIGQVLNGKYKVISLLGEGGMGVVYKVQHLLLQKKNIFALKILRSHFSVDSEFHARFFREVEVTMGLTHENIVQVRDFGITEDGLHFFTMDYFPGRSLKAVIEENGVLPTSRAINILRQVLLALREAHKANVIHRDLKPDNILVQATPDGEERVRVLDFGIAKLIEGEEGDAGLTQGNLIGTPKYMSPEQCSGDPLDGRSDLYSLGVILYEMLLGRVPFSAGTTRTILMHQITAEPPPFRTVRPDLEIPFLLEKLVLQLLSKDRDARPLSAEYVLEEIQAEVTVRQTGLQGPRRVRRKARLALSLALVAISALAIEHFLPWRTFMVEEAEAERLPPPAPQSTWTPSALPSSAANQGFPAAPGGKAPEPPQSTPPQQPVAPAKAKRPTTARVRCEICGQDYRRGEKVGGMCHGLPLVEAR